MSYNYRNRTVFSAGRGAGSSMRYIIFDIIMEYSPRYPPLYYDFLVRGSPAVTSRAPPSEIFLSRTRRRRAVHAAAAKSESTRT